MTLQIQNPQVKHSLLTQTSDKRLLETIQRFWILLVMHIIIKMTKLSTTITTALPLESTGE